MLGKKKAKKEPEQPEQTEVIDTLGQPPKPEHFDGFMPKHFNTTSGVFEAEVCNLLLGINQRLDILIKMAEEETQ